MIDGLERILLEKYQPDSPKLKSPLEAPVSVSENEGVSDIKEVAKESQEASEEVLEDVSPTMKALLELIDKIHNK